MWVCTYLVKIVPLSTLLKNESGALKIVRSQLIILNVHPDVRHDGLSKNIVKLDTRLHSHYVK